MDDNTNQVESQEPEVKPGYYAVIPAQVRYDESIPANAKLLYGEISALLDSSGICFASNDYFARLYGCTTVTVARLMGKLEEAGYIQREMERDGNGQVMRRKIRLSLSMPDAHPLNNFVKTPPQFCGEGGNKNVKDTNTSISNKKENKKEKGGKKKPAPPEAEFYPMPLFVDWISRNFPDRPPAVKNRLYLALERFVENRVVLKKPMKSKASVTALCNRLVKLTYADTEKMVELLDTATVNGWQSVYTGKDAPATKSEDEGDYICL